MSHLSESLDGFKETNTQTVLKSEEIEGEIRKEE